MPHTKPPELRIVPVEVEAREDLVSRLEELLDAAKKGEIHTLFYVEATSRNTWRPSWVGANQDRIYVLGMLEAIKWELLYNAEKYQADA